MRVYKDTKDKIVLVTYKIDGVRGIKSKEGWISRAGKPLYNLPEMPDGEYEIYLSDFKSSISACRTHVGIPIDPLYLYRLLPDIDDRLRYGPANVCDIESIFDLAIKTGYEGLVIYTSKGPFKIKQKLTFDCIVIDIQPGTGKYLGKMGALIVQLEGVEFKVGTGFTDKDRTDFNNPIDIVGEIIEVEGMEVLPSGKLRHPRFIRLREDLK